MCREKEKAEDRVYAVVWREFRRQRKDIRETLERVAPERKAILGRDADFYLRYFDKPFWTNAKFDADLMTLLVLASQNGVDLFANSIALQVDWTLVNTAAADWARKYSGTLIKKITETTVDGLRSAIAAFVETPGMTIGDLMRLLPFSEQRALMVGVTEITRAYSVADELAGNELQKEFPDVEVVKTWWTNNDDIVQECPICWPLHGMTVKQDEGFTTDPDKSFGLPGPPGHVRCRCWRSTTTRI